MKVHVEPASGEPTRAIGKFQGDTLDFSMQHSLVSWLVNMSVHNSGDRLG